MSLAIDIDKVCAVLLADGWHFVKDNSFTLDAYEMYWGKESDIRRNKIDWVLKGGDLNDVCSTGFSFEETVSREEKNDTDVILYGPLTSILAVKITKSYAQKDLPENT